MLTKISCTDHSTIILLSQIFIINGINRTKMLSKEFLIRINGKRVHYTDPTRFEDLWKLNYRSQSQKNIKNSYFKALFYNLHFQRKNKGAWIVLNIFETLHIQLLSYQNSSVFLPDFKVERNTSYPFLGCLAYMKNLSSKKSKNCHKDSKKTCTSVEI